MHARPNRPAALDEVALRFHDFAQDWSGVLVEVKSFGVALHYRMCPAAAVAAGALASRLAKQFDLHLQDGKMMVELRVAGGDKGAAVERLMSRPPMRGTAPIFAGDDITDEAGFAAACKLGGHAIIIGERRPTAANFSLPSPGALREWLWEAVR